MPCLELAYRTRTTMHTFTPPNTTAKKRKLLATVAGRDLPAQQLQHSGHRESFVHCNSAIMDRVGQFNSSLSKRAGHQAGHYWQCKLLHRMPTTNKSNQTIKLGNQADKQPTPQMELQTRRTSLCANNQPDSTTFKNVTVTKTAIKQASVFNKTSAKPMTSIRAASKQGSPIIKKGMAIKNFIKSGSTSAQKIMAHNPWLASNTPSSETNKHVNYSINCHTRKHRWILDASRNIVVPQESTHLTNTS